MKKAIILLLILCGCLFISSPLVKSIFAESSQNISINQNETLTQEQAKELLLKYNNEVNYIYQGDADSFQVLKAKNLNGYVFLPNVDTDIGYFVDKNNSNIYFFHPSGYLELIK